VGQAVCLQVMMKMSALPGYRWQPPTRTRAARLIADADHITPSLTDKPDRATALAGVATTLAVTDPDRAHLSVRQPDDWIWRLRAIVAVVIAVAFSLWAS
jgi:hypothetical protein